MALTAADFDPHQGVVVFGLSVQGGQPTMLGVYPGVWGYWIRYDPSTGRRIGNETWEMNTGTGILMADDMKSGATGYRFFKVPPGDYAIGFMRDVIDKVATNYILVAGTLRQVYNQYSTGARAEVGDPTLLPEARVLPSTPRFHVGAGEVIYIGDLHFDVGDRFGLHLSLGQNDAAARAFAATAGADAAERMISRPVIHVDGSPIGHPDVIPTVASSQLQREATAPALTPSTEELAAAGATINGFGLVGTWSADCSKDASEGMGRVTFAVPSSGEATVDSETRVARTHFTVLGAERIGTSELHLRLRTVQISFAAPVVKSSASTGQEIDQVIEKSGDKYQIRESRRVGGDVFVQDGMLMQAKQPMPMMAKCGGP